MALTAERFAAEVVSRSFFGKAADALELALLYPTRPLASLERKGRAGALGLLAGGALLALPAVPMVVLGLMGSPRVLVLGLVAAWAAGSALFRGARSLLHPRAVAKMTLAELEARLAYRPVVVCLSCRLVVSTIPCPLCGSAADCLEVRSDEDQTMAMASLSARDA